MEWLHCMALLLGYGLMVLGGAFFFAVLSKLAMDYIWQRIELGIRLSEVVNAVKAYREKRK